MEYGLCCGPERAPALKAAGYDYFESTVGALLCPEAPEADFDARRAAHAAAGLPCPVLALFLPGDLRVTGPELDRDRQRRYLDTVFPRARKAGVDTIVFGSGGARRVPDGFPQGEAWGQLAAFARAAGEAAAPHGVRLAMEPLNAKECNILTTLAETLRFVDEVGHPAVRALVDAYHWGRERESAEVIASAGARLVHVHVATTANRVAPGAEPCPFDEFARGLRGARYGGRMSIEARVDEENFPAAAAAALAALRAVGEAAKA